MEHTIIDYFSTIFQSNGPSDATTIVEVIQPKVIENMNVELECDFLVDEVFNTLKKMNKKKHQVQIVCLPFSINTIGP